MIRTTLLQKMIRKSSSRTTLASLFVASAALADPTDVFGFGPRAAAMGGAFSALSDDASSSLYNPAGSAVAAEPVVSLGYGAGIADLELSGADARITQPRGTSFGLTVPFEVLGLPVGAGFALYLPDQFVARLRAIPSDEERYILLDNSIHRIVVSPTVSVRPLPWLAIGGGVSLLADLSGNGVTFELSAPGGEAQGDSSLDVELPTRAAPLLGVIALPTDRLRLGLAWRGAVDLDVRLDLLADVDFPGVVEGDSLVSARVTNYYTPHRLSLGAAYDLLPSTTLAAELTYLRWSEFEGDVAQIRFLVNLSVAPGLVLVGYEPQTFRDVIVPRLGLEHRRSHSTEIESTWRAGFYYERSPVPDQTGLTSLADNDRVVGSLGAGLNTQVGEVFPKPMSLDLTFQLHQLVGRSARKDSLTGPSLALSSGGRIYHGSLIWSVRF